MGYVEENLITGEQIIVRAKLHWGMFIGPFVTLGTGMLLGLLSFIPFVSILMIGKEKDNVAGTMACLLCCAGPLLLFGIFRLLEVAVSYFTTEFALTDRRIIAKTGLFRRRSLEMMLNKIESINVTQPIMGRILNYGSIVVCGSGGTKQDFHNIADPMILRQRINSQVAGNAQN